MTKKIIWTSTCIPDYSVLAEDILDENNAVLLTTGTKLSEANLKLLIKNHISTVSILVSQNQPQLKSNMEITYSEIIDAKMKYALEQEIEGAFSDPLNLEVQTEKLEAIVKQIVEKLALKSNLFLQVNNINQKCNALYMHCVNVSVFAIVLGITMGLPVDDVVALGIGGLLHDIGKLQIPNEILNKPDKLTMEEYMIIRKHVTFGYNILKHEASIDHWVLLMALQHHEHCNGKGYPWGITEFNIHPLSQIIAVADVYEAMTSQRSYRSRIASETVIKSINQGVGTQFSASVVEAFNSIAVPYNIGELVQLNSGLKGRVTRINSADLYHPYVFTEQGMLNLMKVPDINIVGTL